MPILEAVPASAKQIFALLIHFNIRPPDRFRRLRNRLHLNCRRKIYTTPLSFRHNSHESLAEAFRDKFASYIFLVNRYIRHEATEVRASPQLGSVFGPRRWCANFHREPIAVSLNYWQDIGLFAILVRKEEGRG